MGLFNEQTLAQSGLSAVEFFSRENNQKDVLEELSAFHDAELIAAFEKIFQSKPLQKEDGSEDKMTLNEYRTFAKKGGFVPVVDQLDIIKGKDPVFIRALVSHQKLDAAAEQQLFRQKDLPLLVFYLKRHKISLTSQIHAVHKKSLLLLKTLLERQYLEFLAQRELVTLNKPKALKLLLEKQTVSTELQVSIIRLGIPELTRLLIEKNALIAPAQAALLATQDDALAEHFIGNITLLAKHPQFTPEMEMLFVTKASDASLKRFIEHNFFTHRALSYLIKERNPLLIKFYLRKRNGLYAADL